MEHLRLHRNLFTNPECIQAHLPHLKQLIICNAEQKYSEMVFQHEHLQSVLHLNPQLEIVKIT